MKKNIETFIGCDADYESAKIAVFGAPFDSTTSFRPGARFGSSAIRHESFGLETYSPYQDKDLADIRVFDCGDLELCFGSAEAALRDIEEKAGEILADGIPEGRCLPLADGQSIRVGEVTVHAIAARRSDIRRI